MIDLGIDHVRRHHRRERDAEPAVRQRVVVEDRVEGALVDRHRDVRIGRDVAVAGEVLAAVRHAGEREAVHQALREHRHDARVAMERAIADHRARPVVEVEHRRERQVDAARRRGRRRARSRRPSRARVATSAPRARVGVPQRAEASHRRQHDEAVATKALHAAALVVDGDQEVGPRVAHRGDELDELRPALEVSREEDRATGVRMREASAIVGVERRAADVEHHRPAHRDPGSMRSTTANATA